MIKRNGQVSLFDERDELREDKDWIESDEFAAVYKSYRRSHHQHQSSSLTTTTTATIEPITVESTQAWYYNRTIEIEDRTGLVDVALSFAELAIINGCKNMNELVENLRTLSTLVYECTRVKSRRDAGDDDLPAFFTLDQVASLGDLERITLIMRHAYETSHELYVKNLQEWLLPFVARQPTLKQREALLKSNKINLYPN